LPQKKKHSPALLSANIDTLHQHPPPLPLMPPHQIIFKSRLGGRNVGNDCTMTINETDFQIPDPTPPEEGHSKMMGLWSLHHAVTTTLVGLDLASQLKSWITVGCQMIPACIGSGSKPTLNDSHIHSKHVKGD
jgi:hypothetical protein